MKQSSGFSLIEIMIALAISAVLGIILYRSFTQSTKLMQQVRDLIDEHSDTLTAYAQIEKDFTGAFMPADETVPKTTPVAPTPPTPAQTPNSPQQPQPDFAKATTGKQPEPEKRDITPFTTTTADGKIASISFVTTNALSIFDEITPRSVRVTYRFKQQTEQPIPGTVLSTLMREEAPYDQKRETDKKSSETKATHTYELVQNISARSVSFSAFHCKKDETKELVTLAEWGTDEQKKKAAELKLPEFIELKLEVTDVHTQRATETVYAITLPAAQCQQCKRAERKAPAPVQQLQQQVTQQTPGTGANKQPTMPPGSRTIFNSLGGGNRGQK